MSVAWRKNPSGLPYCSRCLGMGCASCEMEQSDEMRKVTVVDAFLLKYLRGRDLVAVVESRGDLVDMIHAAIEYGRKQVQIETMPLFREPEDPFHRFGKLDLAPMEKSECK